MMIKYENYKEIFKNKEAFKLLIDKASKLNLIEENLIITDFDDTIFSTQESLDADIRKWRRWEEWNKFIINKVWLNNFISNFYLNKNYPKLITSKLREKKDLILTVWFKEIQEAKIKACQLDKYNYLIVPYQIEKIFTVIDYTINSLKYLPSEITIYDDRFEIFIKYKPLLENILKVKINIIKVDMNWNDWEINLTLIK